MHVVMCTFRAGPYGLVDFFNLPCMWVILDIAVVTIGTTNYFAPVTMVTL